MMRFLSQSFSKIIQKYMPNSFIFAILLTFVVMISALFVETPQGNSNTLFNLITYWGDGFWGLLSFSMQMALIVVTGTALASTSLVKNFLNNITLKLNTPTKAIIGTAIFSAVTCWIHYGFGLISSALLARKIACNIRKGLHYPLLVATAYSGFLVWHGGLSASIPLLVAMPGGDKAMSSVFGPEASVSLSQTIFSPLNIILSVSMMILLPLMAYLMMPKSEEALSLSDEILEKIKIEEKNEPTPDFSTMTFAQKIENSPVITILTVLMGIIYLFLYIKKGGTISINTVTFILLMVGLMLHKTPHNYIKAFGEGVKETSGILLQFPFYGGIMGIMISSGLGLSMTEFFVNISNEQTFPIYTFLVSGLVNFFVPSGGGQWAVQGHFVLNTAQQLNANLPKAILAISWGDAWTNMIQPFWALPLLSVAKLDVKDILGYTIPILIVSGVIITTFFAFFPM